MSLFLAVIFVGLGFYSIEAAVFGNSTTFHLSASSTAQVISTADHSNTSVNINSSTSTTTQSVIPYCDPSLQNCDVPGGPYWNIFDFENPYLLDMNNDSAIAANPSLQRLCSNSWLSLFSQYKSTASWSSWTTTYTWTATTRVETINNYRQHTTKTVTDEALTATGTQIEYPVAPSLSMSSPCCFECTLWGGNIEVYFWPLQTTSSFAQTLVNPDGYTFIYPSIYVSFQTLSAWDYCSTIGPGYANKTVAFDPSELSTAPHAWSFGHHWSKAPRLDSVWTAATFGEVTSCTEDVTTTIFVLNDASETVTEILTYNPCSPQLSVPTKLYSLDPGWKNCRSALNGFWDPPYYLTPGSGLSTLSVADGNDPPPFVPQFKPTSRNGDAAAGATPSPSTASKTGYPKSTATVTKDPSSNNPPTNDPPADIPSNTPNPVITLGSSIVTGNSVSLFTFGTMSLSAGGIPITIADTVYSLTRDGTKLIVITSNLVFNPTPYPVITIGGATINGDSASVFKVGTASLSLGGHPITVSGTAYSLTTNGNDLIVLTDFLSSTLTPAVFVIGTQTLAAGEAAITISGTVLSLEAGGKTVVVGSVTQDLSSWLQVISTATSSGGIGSIIAGMGGFATPTPDSTSTAGNGSEGYSGDPFLGKGSRVFQSHVWIIGLVLVFWGCGSWIL